MLKSLLILILLCGFKTFAADYVPIPHKVQTPYLIGVHYFPGWKQGTHLGWEKIVPFPERKPLLGWYDEGNPEVADWEIKWCVEHGISFFVYCWYRYGEASPVQSYLSHAIHDGLFNAKYRDLFHFAIMWENANGSGVASEKDLMENLFPFWIDSYFKLPGYLKIGGKPVLFIYSIDEIAKDLGGISAVHAAFEKMRALAKARGFKGLLILAQYPNQDIPSIHDIKSCGYDATFAYSWGGNGASPSPSQAIQNQFSWMENFKKWSIIPFVPCLSVGWDERPWNPNDPQHWRIPPSDFKAMCIQAKSLMLQLPSQELGSKMLIIGSWNEWGEGHYIAPCKQNGFGYLDAIRDVFSTAPKKHRDLVPSDVGLGPYDSLFRKAHKADSLTNK